jgi:hypothetical protein
MKKNNFVTKDTIYKEVSNYLKQHTDLNSTALKEALSPYTKPIPASIKAYIKSPSTIVENPTVDQFIYRLYAEMKVEKKNNYIQQALEDSKSIQIPADNQKEFFKYIFYHLKLNKQISNKPQAKETTYAIQHIESSLKHIDEDYKALYLVEVLSGITKRINNNQKPKKEETFAIPDDVQKFIKTLSTRLEPSDVEESYDLDEKKEIKLSGHKLEADLEIGFVDYSQRIRLSFAHLKHLNLIDNDVISTMLKDVDWNLSFQNGGDQARVLEDILNTVKAIKHPNSNKRYTLKEFMNNKDKLQENTLSTHLHSVYKQIKNRSISIEYNGKSLSNTELLTLIQFVGKDEVIKLRDKEVNLLSYVDEFSQYDNEVTYEQAINLAIEYTNILKQNPTKTNEELKELLDNSKSAIDIKRNTEDITDGISDIMQQAKISMKSFLGLDTSEDKKKLYQPQSLSQKVKKAKIEISGTPNDLLTLQHRFKNLDINSISKSHLQHTINYYNQTLHLLSKISSIDETIDIASGSKSVFNVAKSNIIGSQTYFELLMQQLVKNNITPPKNTLDYQCYKAIKLVQEYQKDNGQILLNDLKHLNNPYVVKLIKNNKKLISGNGISFIIQKFSKYSQQLYSTSSIIYEHRNNFQEGMIANKKATLLDPIIVDKKYNTNIRYGLKQDNTLIISKYHNESPAGFLVPSGKRGLYLYKIMWHEAAKHKLNTLKASSNNQMENKASIEYLEKCLSGKQDPFKDIFPKEYQKLQQYPDYLNTTKDYPWKKDAQYWLKSVGIGTADLVTKTNTGIQKIGMDIAESIVPKDYYTYKNVSRNDWDATRYFKQEGKKFSEVSSLLKIGKKSSNGFDVEARLQEEIATAHAKDLWLDSGYVNMKIFIKDMPHMSSRDWAVFATGMFATAYIATPMAVAMRISLSTFGKVATNMVPVLQRLKTLNLLNSEATLVVLEKLYGGSLQILNDMLLEVFINAGENQDLKQALMDAWMSELVFSAIADRGLHLAGGTFKAIFKNKKIKSNTKPSRNQLIETINTLKQAGLSISYNDKDSVETLVGHITYAIANVNKKVSDSKKLSLPLESVPASQYPSFIK